MTEGYFSKIANDVLEATEQLSVRLEEGLSALMTGTVPADKAEPQAMPEMSEEEVDMVKEGLMGSPLEGIAESVVGDIMMGQKPPETLWEHIEAFKSAVTWSEPFILSLIAFQVVMFLLCIWVSRRNRGIAPRLVMMFLVGGIVRSAEYLNTLGAANWETFATQNYFDKQGFFVMIMVCCPLLLDSLIMLLLFVREAAQLLVQVKTAELKKKRQQEAKNGKEGKTRRAKKEQ